LRQVMQQVSLPLDMSLRRVAAGANRAKMPRDS